MSESTPMVRLVEEYLDCQRRLGYRRVRRFLPALLKHVSFIAAPAGEAVVETYNYLRDRENAPASG